MNAGRALSKGLNECPFKSARPYFETALSVVKLRGENAKAAGKDLLELSKNEDLSPTERGNVLLFSAHALAKAGNSNGSCELLQSAEIVDFATARQKRLAGALRLRFNLDADKVPSTYEFRELDNRIVNLEIDLLTQSITKKAA